MTLHRKRWKNSLGEVLVTVTKTSTTGGRPGEEFWLTEEQALFLVTKSDTPNAVALTKEMIRIFLLVKNGEADALRLERDQAVLRALDVQAGIVQSLQRQVALLAARADNDMGIAGAAGTAINNRISSIARIMAGPTATTRERRQIRRRVDQRIREAVQFPMGRSHRWELLPRLSSPKAALILEQVEHEAKDLDHARNVARQLMLEMLSPQNDQQKHSA